MASGGVTVKARNIVYIFIAKTIEQLKGQK